MTVAVVVVAGALAGGLFALHRSSAPPSPTTTTAPGQKGGAVPATGGPFTVSATSILLNGAPYLPYGVTIYGLSSPDWQSTEQMDLQRIAAIAGFWHGNTVRIQVAPTLEASQGPAYLAAIQHEVATARADGLNVIISAQYERTSKIPGPDAGTVTFWRSIAPLYAADPNVWFDLFNEPTEGTHPRTSSVPTSSNWEVWRNGGGSIVGMQTIVDDIRAVAPQNLIIAEGLKGGKTLAGIGDDLLTGGNIVYSVHPYFGPDNRTPSQWDENFGTPSSQIPVLIGEWGQVESDTRSCVDDAPSLVPEFLAYVTAHHIGLIAWALDPGVMIRGTNLDDPTAFDPGAAYVCGRSDMGSQAQGPGALILSMFSSAR